MRFLGIGEYCDLSALYLRLMQAGHEVKVFVENPDYYGIYSGLLTFTKNWHDELEWICQAKSEGIILFESATKGIIQDALRQQGYQVIGGSAFGDNLEACREYGQQMMQKMDVQLAPTFKFNDFDAAISFINKSPKRYVYKNNHANSERTQNYVGMSVDGSDLIVLLQHYKNKLYKSKLHESNQLSESTDFVLMEYISGIEIGIGAFFNGERFLQPACLDWEHKHFFCGDLGELTGEMGTVVTYRGAENMFNKTLLHLESHLKASGYCGYINLNLIANAQGLWPLEFSSRFGYPGYSICGALHQVSWPDLFKKLLQKTSLHFETHPGYAVGVVVNVPPFPYKYGYNQLSKGLPIIFAPLFNDFDHFNFHLSEVALVNDQLITSGVTGNIGTAIAVSDSVEGAQKAANELAAKIIVPNVRYRQDIGTKLIKHELQQLIDWGHIAV